jgi:hypothetical protein
MGGSLSFVLAPHLLAFPSTARIFSLDYWYWRWSGVHVMIQACGQSIGIVLAI